MAKIYAYLCTTESIINPPIFFSTMTAARTYMKDEFIGWAKSFGIYDDVTSKWGNPDEWNPECNKSVFPDIQDVNCRYSLGRYGFSFGFYDLSFVMGEIREMDTEKIETVINVAKKMEGAV